MNDGGIDCKQIHYTPTVISEHLKVKLKPSWYNYYDNMTASRCYLKKTIFIVSTVTD